MGRVALLAVRATEMALADAGLLDEPSVRDGRMGVAYGSSAGSVGAGRRSSATCSPPASMEGVTSTSYIQMMPHTTAVNIGLCSSAQGTHRSRRSSACTSGSQAHRLRLRGDPLRQAGAHGGGRRRGAVGARRGGVRHAVRHQHAQRRARSDAAALRPRPRRPGGRRRRGDAGARGARARARARRAHPRRDRRLRHQLRRRPRHRARGGDDGAASCSSRWRMRGLPPRRSATSTPTAPPPRSATSPRARPRRRCSGPRMPDQLA